MSKYFTLIMSLFFVSSLFAQNQLSSKIELRNDVAKHKLANSSDFPTFLKAEFQNLGLNAPEDLVFERKFETQGNWTRERFSQNYKGLPVLGTGVIAHSKDGKFEKVSGEILPLINVDIQPKNSLDKTKEILKNSLIQHAYEEGEDPIKIFEEIEFSSERLVIVDKAYPKFSGDYALAYEIEASFEAPHYHKSKYVLDANTGKQIQTIDRICHVGVDGVANTRYYGEQAIRTDSIGPGQYRLFDDERNVVTVNANERDFGSPFNYELFTDEDNYWDNNNEDLDEVAGDAHYCTSKYHDFMDGKFGWDGVDGNGGNLVSVVHVGGRYFLNAYWDGSATYYGNGQCIDYGPLTTLDVIGHEFAHGFTQFTSGLIYRDESGALNEAISDIFGKALEYEYDEENFNWYIGKRFITGDADPFRNMADPNELESPDFYKGEYWITGFFDNGGVHFNSGVYNYWFHMLVEGKAGVNEAGNSYDVKSIGWEKALDIVYGAQVGYFTPSTNYVDAYNHTLAYAEDVWGAASDEYAAVAEAWYAVGLSNDIEQSTVITGNLLIDDLAFTLCTGETLEVTLDVVNTGIQTVEAGEVIKMRYLLDNVIQADQNIELTEDFNPGDSILFTFDKIIEHDPFDNQKYLQVMMAVGDSEEYEQIDYDFINFRDGESSDLVLDRVELSPNICSDGSFLLIYYFQLESCEFIPEGEIIYLTFDIGGQEVVVERPVNFPIRPSITYINITSINFPFDLELFNEYDVTISHPLDEFPGNNSLSSFFLTHEEMGNNDIEDYELFSDEYSPFISLDPGFTHDTETKEREGDLWLGIGSNSSFFTPTPCPDPEDIYDLYYFYSTSQSVCMNTLDMTEPVLRFEMANYYSEMVEDLDPGFSNMTKILIQDGSEDGIEFPIIHSIEEGVTHAFEYDLPVGYGTLSLNTLCMLGDQFEFTNGTFNNSDVALFNNVRIEEKTVSSAKDIVQLDLSVYPNPASSEVFFEWENEGDFTLNIYDVHGKSIYNASKLTNNHSWLNQNALNGIYIYRLKDDKGNQHTGKLILE